MTEFHPSFFVITGSPCSGRSTLLQSLEDRYFTVMEEGEKSIIRNQVAIDGKALPWKDKQTYSELLLDWELNSYHKAPTNQPVFFDRGIPDIIAYLEMHQLPVPDYLTKAAKQFRYHQTVFIAPFSSEIYNPNISTWKTKEEAQAMSNAVASVYQRFGYNAVLLPDDGLENRVKLVIDAVNKLSSQK